MKKLDKLILQAFLGPFVLTFCVVVFILLTQTIMKYFDDFVGKGLGLSVFAELIFYFSLNVTPIALPLAVLLSSLIAFGNLGEHYELTAIKSAGISLIRVLIPIFLFTVLVTIGAFWFNNSVVPKANLRAYSLLYDIRTKKATLNIKEGIFYNGLPKYSIKANKKFPDGQTLKELIIYDHTDDNGNSRVILADSGIMKTIRNDQYLVLELFNGKRYDQQATKSGANSDEFMRNDFQRSKLVFDLSSFRMNITDKDLFKDNRMMKNIGELDHIWDSLQRESASSVKYLFPSLEQYYAYHLKKTPPGADTLRGKWLNPLVNSSYDPREKQDILSRAVTQARNARSFVESTKLRRENNQRDSGLFAVEKFKKYTQSLACLVMFLIGAPLGAIIKKGGLGVPVLVSIVFFIIFYVFSILGEKWSKEGVVLVPYGMWGANFILFWAGMLFLRQARNDSRLLEADVYIAGFNRFLKKVFKPRERTAVSAG
ncbi:MAG: LptF/LptG family permease [Ferruginibacter sp.]|nr:LptF/LptG family permease [Cytophagales bacterium]